MKEKNLRIKKYENQEKGEDRIWWNRIRESGIGDAMSISSFFLSLNNNNNKCKLPQHHGLSPYSFPALQLHQYDLEF